MGRNSLYYKNKGLDILHVFISVILGVLIVLAVFRVAFGLCYFSVHVVGDSMKGTLYNGDYVYAYNSSSPKRGDIVVIEAPDKTIIKRVIALGGDRVKLDKGVLYLNGVKVDEPYVKAENNKDDNYNTYPKDAPYVVVPEGKMFFLGDNRDNSDDSRGSRGMMSVNSIIGVVADWSLNLKGAITAFNSFFDSKPDAVTAFNKSGAGR